MSRSCRGWAMVEGSDRWATRGAHGTSQPFQSADGYACAAHTLRIRYAYATQSHCRCGLPALRGAGYVPTMLYEGTHLSVLLKPVVRLLIHSNNSRCGTFWLADWLCAALYEQSTGRRSAWHTPTTTTMGCCSSQPQADGTYNPSKCVFCVGKAGLGSTWDRAALPLPAAADDGAGRILVVCTDQHALRMANGKSFNTGHNVSETLLPLAFLDAAGYDFDFATPSGGGVKLEAWSWAGPVANGHEDVLRELYGKLEAKMNAPLTTEAAAEKFLAREYEAVFMPGGHGAMINLHDDAGVTRVLAFAHEQRMPTAALCHGPNALRAAPEGTYTGYAVAAFPDSGDKQSPGVGYMPGQMTEFLGEELGKLGIRVVNAKADDTTHVDRELITGASPAAAAKLGALMVDEFRKRRANPDTWGAAA